MYLKRYHEVTISPSGVWRILKRLDLNRLPASQRHKTYQKRWKRYEKPLPGHQAGVDVKFITSIGRVDKRFYQFTAINDCTRTPNFIIIQHQPPPPWHPTKPEVGMTGG
jgi:hypothetical protein